MRQNTLKHRLVTGENVLCSWLWIPSSFSAELMASLGFDAVNVDLQHGMIGFDAAVPMLQAISTSEATPIARVPALDPPMIMKLLDAGAYGIICPMISTVAEAERFVRACRYPPLGNRSLGPARALIYGGADYLQHANTEILTLGMIETREGLSNVGAIAAVDGLDMLFVGPNDLSIALGVEPSSEPEDPTVMAAIDTIRRAAAAAGKPCGMFCSSGRAAAARMAEGFQLVVPGYDAGLMTQAAIQERDAALGR